MGEAEWKTCPAVQPSMGGVAPRAPRGGKQSRQRRLVPKGPEAAKEGVVFPPRGARSGAPHHLTHFYAPDRI